MYRASWSKTQGVMKLAASLGRTFDVTNHWDRKDMVDGDFYVETPLPLKKK